MGKKADMKASANSKKAEDAAKVAKAPKGNDPKDKRIREMRQTIWLECVQHCLAHEKLFFIDAEGEERQATTDKDRAYVARTFYDEFIKHEPKF